MIIYTDTGEIIRELEQGDVIVKRKSIEHLKDNIKIPKEEQFIKMYRSSVALLNECSLSGCEYAIVLHLASHLRYQSNIAKYDNGKLINRENLKNDLQFSDETIKRSIRKLISMGILCEVSSTAGKVFIMNPFIFNVGEVVGKTVIDLFKKSKWCNWNTVL